MVSGPGEADPSRVGGGPVATPREAGASPTLVKEAIDRGAGADKVAFPDPAAAPLGVDDEAGGAPNTAAQVRAALAHETRGPAKTPGPVTAWGPLTGTERFRGAKDWGMLAAGGALAGAAALAFLNLLT